MIEKFRLIVGDCRQNMDGLKADYIFTVPPDFDEIGLNPRNTRDYADYYYFLTTTCDMAMLVSPIITIAITDRKCDGAIISKHAFLIDLFRTRCWQLLSHKIWVKTVNRNLYRLTYTNIMSFAKKKPKQTHHSAYERDVFISTERPYRKYEYGINPDVVEPFIWNFTNEGDTILDPFLGSGTTAVVALQNGRKCIGIEAKEEVAKLARARVKEEGDLPRARKLFE